MHRKFFSNTLINDNAGGYDLISLSGLALIEYSVGEGKNLIELNGVGNTTVHNFINGGAQVTLESVAANSGFVEILMFTDETESKVAVAKPGDMIKFANAEIYLGRENAAVDFGGTTENLFFNLSNDQPAITGVRQKQFFGITRVTASDGLSTLIGADANETLIAGNGHISILGGNFGNDLLIGGESQNTFFYYFGDGDDTVSNFEFVTRENRASGSANKIEILSDIVTRGTCSGDDVILQLNDGDDYLTIEDAAGKDFRLNNFIVKVDRNVAYDGLSNYYVAEIWPDSSHGTLFFGNIRVLNASNAAGYTSLVGNKFDNTIIAGQNNSGLWGGSFGNDLLIGGDSLKIDGSADITYQPADGSKYKANHESLTCQ